MRCLCAHSKRKKIETQQFVGYKDRVKGYKLWNLVTGIVVYSRDVIFREDKILLRMKMSKEKRNKKSLSSN